jgi:hypothetical protein
MIQSRRFVIKVPMSEGIRVWSPGLHTGCTGLHVNGPNCIEQDCMFFHAIMVKCTGSLGRL